MAKFWKSKEFLKEKLEWDTILRATGFVDIEKDHGEDRTLVDTASSGGGWSGAYKGASAVEIDAKSEYYILLYQWFSKEVFDNEIDKLIMERTADGKSIKEISDELKSLPDSGLSRPKHHRCTIRYIRRRYENKWGIKNWLPHQMKKAPIQS